MMNTDEITRLEGGTLVFWDINNCPIPDGFDPRLVGPRIESALEKSGYSGPLTITAIGDLRETPGDKVLRELSSTLVALRHDHGFHSALYEWASKLATSVAIMVISTATQLESLTLGRTLYQLGKRGNKILLAYPRPHPAPGLIWACLLRGASKAWIFHSLLEGAFDCVLSPLSGSSHAAEVDSGASGDKQKTTRLVLPDFCRYCSVCLISFGSIENFTRNLKSVEHAYVEWACNARKTNGTRFEVKPPPPNDDPETVKVWDLLYDADLLGNRFGKMLSPGPVIYPPSNINVFTIIKRLSKENCPKDEMIMHNEVTQHGEEEEEGTLVTQHGEEEEEEGTLVLWDIVGCPIPDGYDPHLVVPRIESALKNSGASRSGPLTIIAIGDLSKVTGDNVLPVLSSSGIALKHDHVIFSALYKWTDRNPSPATIMLISGSSQLECLARSLYYHEKEPGYRIFLACPQLDPTLDLLLRSFLRGVSKVWLWKNLLEDEVDSGTADNKQETTRLVLPDLCPEKDESPWYCSLCHFAAQSIENFTTHLKGVGHAYSEWDRLASKHRVNRFEVKPPPPNDDPETIKVWDLLHDADLLSRRFEDMLSDPFFPPGNINLSTIVKRLTQEKCRTDKMMMHNELTQYKKKEKNEVTQYKEKEKSKEHAHSTPDVK